MIVAIQLEKHACMVLFWSHMISERGTRRGCIGTHQWQRQSWLEAMANGEDGVEVPVAGLHRSPGDYGHRWCTGTYRAAHLVFVARESTETTARGMATRPVMTMTGEDQTERARRDGKSRVRPPWVPATTIVAGVGAMADLQIAVQSAATTIIRRNER
jgi:hypothetical protein